MTSAAFRPPEIALSLSRPESLDRLLDLEPDFPIFRCLERLGSPLDGLNADASDWPVKRIHLGNEFCERLITTPAKLKSAQCTLKQLGLELTLITPMLTDAGLVRFDNLLRGLSGGTEVVFNDWGMLRRLRADYTSLVPVLGRMLNKMIKDPRLPSEQWAQLHPYMSGSKHFHSLLDHFNVERMEMDVPPFAKVEQFNSSPMGLGVHIPYGYTLKGRMCRIGSLNLKDNHKFIPAHACQKECLTYWTRLERPGRESNTEIYSFQRGNTQFYRHSGAMTAAVWSAIGKGWIGRLIFSGDWHENYGSAKQA